MYSLRIGVCNVIVISYTVPDGTRSYAMVPGSRITSRVPSSEFKFSPLLVHILCSFCCKRWYAMIRDGTRWYPTVPERALDHFASNVDSRVSHKYTDYKDRLGRTERLLGRTRNVMEGAAHPILPTAAPSATLTQPTVV